MAFKQKRRKKRTPVSEFSEPYTERAAPWDGKEPLQRFPEDEPSEALKGLLLVRDHGGHECAYGLAARHEIGYRCQWRASDGCLWCALHWETVRTPEGRAAKYAVASVLYYQHDVTIWSDGEFDALCRTMLDEGDADHVPWLEPEMLRAGSGYDMTKLPGWAVRLAKERTT